jgi:F-box protein 21
LKAIALCEYLRDNDLLGISGEARYHDLRNNFIGIALQDEHHPSLPLISVAIFCCIATRLGIDAQPCGFPFHVLAIIKPPPGRTLDGVRMQSVDSGPPMYMDPFRSSQETNVQHLRSQLQSLGVPSSDHSNLLDASTIEEIVRRSAKNIIASVQALPRQEGAAPMSTVPSFPEMDGALYAALWSLILFPEGGQDVAALQRTRYLGFIVERMANQYSMDVGLIEEHILPLITDPGHRQSLIETIRVIRTGDHTPKKFKPRSPDIGSSVRYKVGQVFHHKRYHYQAIITGWDLKCEQGPIWMADMGIHTLPRGEYQSFYHVL